MLTPTGFWSYTSSDDERSRGRLSQLRKLLADELQQKIGRVPEVQILQDVAAIPPGRDWEKQINEALATSSFFIPIVTPGFLQSEWCCREVLRFHEQATMRGRDDLILPLKYDRLMVLGLDIASLCLTRDCPPIRLPIIEQQLAGLTSLPQRTVSVPCLALVGAIKNDPDCDAAIGRIDRTIRGNVVAFGGIG